MIDKELILNNEFRKSIKSMIISDNNDDFDLAKALLGVERHLQNHTLRELRMLKSLFSVKLGRHNSMQAATRTRFFGFRNEVMKWEQIKRKEERNKCQIQQ